MPQLDRAIVKERARRLRERGVRALRAISMPKSARAAVLAEAHERGRTEHFTHGALAACRARPIRRRAIAGHDSRQLIAGY